MRLDKIKATFLDRSTLGETSLKTIEELVELESFECTKKEEVSSRIKDKEIVIANKSLLDGESLGEAKKLKLICIAATGMNNVDLDYCNKKGIEVRNVKSYSTFSVAQFTLNLLFHYLHHNNYYFSYTQKGDWSDSKIFTNLAHSFYELEGKTWGIVGLGEIGARLASILEAFGVNVICHSPTGNKKSKKYSYYSLEDLLKKADIVSLHCQYSDLSHEMINLEVLSHAKDLILLNLARGGLIKEEDICKAVDNKYLKAYLTDVMVEEPPPKDHPFLNKKYKDQIFITPHIAWSSKEARERLVQGIKDNIKGYICS